MIAKKIIQFIKLFILLLSVFATAIFFQNSALANENLDSLDDLSVSSISTSPAKPALNQECIILVKIKNSGKRKLVSTTGLSDFSFNFENFIKESTNYTTVSYDKPLAPGEFLTYEFRGKFTKIGASIMSFTIDSDDQLVEISKSNNALKQSIETVTENNIDISYNNLTFSKEKIFVNDPVSIIFEIKNTGSSSLINYSGLLINEDLEYNIPNFDISSTTHDTYPTVENPLEPGGLFKYKLIGQFIKAGPGSIYLKADRNNRLIEANENNNSTSTSRRIFLASEAYDFNLLTHGSSLVSSSSFMVRWNTDIKLMGQVLYKEGGGIDSAEIIAITASATTSQQLLIKNLTPGKPYLYKIIITNGPIMKETGFNELIMPLNDAEFRFTREPKAEADYNGLIRINWSTNLAAPGSLYYKKENEKNYTEIKFEDLLTDQTATLTGLGFYAYSYYVRSTSTAGVMIKSTPAQFTGPGQKTEKRNDTIVTGTTKEQNSQAKIFFETKNNSLYEKLKGKILIKPEDSGKAYYVNPTSHKFYYLGRPDDSFSIMRSQGVGISNNDLEKIQIGLIADSSSDSDKDGLADGLEAALGSDKEKSDTDGDGYSDKQELINGYSPAKNGKKYPLNKSFSNDQKGKILLQIQSHGEAWYVNPKDGKRYFLGRPKDAFQVMRQLGIGINNSDFNKL